MTTVTTAAALVWVAGEFTAKVSMFAAEVKAWRPRRQMEPSSSQCGLRIPLLVPTDTMK